jgi:hypothetical protein
MPSDRENVIDDFVKTELRVFCDSYLDKKQRWVIATCIGIFAIYAGLALYVFPIAKDIKETDRIRREVAIKELETDSIKRATIRSFDKKYDESLKAYYKDRGDVTPKK